MGDNKVKKRSVFKRRKGMFNPDEKVAVKFSGDILTSILAYVISEDRLITRGNLSNVKKLFGLMDLTVYDTDIYNEAKVHYINSILTGKLELYMSKRSLLLDFAYSSKYEDVMSDIMYDLDTYKLTGPDIRYLTSMITDRLGYCFLYVYKDYVMDEFQKLETNDFVHLKDLKDKIMDVVVKLISDIRRAENLEKANMDFTLDDVSTFEAVITKTVNELQSPSCNLKCGIRQLNEMLGGSFESGRFYLGIGISGGFKSGLLLNLLYQFKMNNMNFMTKDPTKKPAILLYTQENTVEETVNRLFSLACGRDQDDRMKNYSAKDAIRLLREKGSLIVDDVNNVNIIVKFAKTKTKTTQDLYYVIDDIEDQGYEVIALIHDYIKRLKSTQGYQEVRHELGAIVDELKALAIEKKIPVISATQLNKEAARIIDEGIQCNKADLGRLLGRSQIGELTLWFALN